MEKVSIFFAGAAAFVYCVCLAFVQCGFCAQVAAKGSCSLYLDDAGIVWEWGFAAQTPRPRLTGVQTVATDGFSILALRRNGEIWGWGGNRRGQVGKGGGGDVAPQKILAHATHVYAGCERGFAIKIDGSLWGWGSSEMGMGVKFEQLPDTALPSSYAIPPTCILPPTVLQVAAACHTLALIKNPQPSRVDGTDADILMAWGDNTCGQVNDTSQELELMMPEVLRIEALQGKRLRKLVAAGYYSLALTEEGDVWKWGSFGVMPCGGMSQEEAEELLPKKIEGVSDIVDISGTPWTIGMLQKDGTLWGLGKTQVWKSDWGIGDKLIKIMSDVQDFAFGDDYLLAIKKDGTLWGLGSNKYGQLGDNTPGWHAKPVRIVIPPMEEADTSGFAR